MRYRLWLAFIAAILMFVGVRNTKAHANLASSSPAANTSLEVPPSEITLQFTEPLESEFSRFTLWDSSGDVVITPSSQVDSANPMQMTMELAPLPDGLYTVVWRVLSTDGHATEGSFAFGVRVLVTASALLPTIDESIPTESAIVRWINLISLSLSIGSVTFWLFVWRPALPEGNVLVEKRMRRWFAFGWVLLGISAILSLMLQASIGADIPLASVISHPAIGETLTNSRFGQIWLARLIYWLGFGILLWFARKESWLYWIVLLIGAQILLTTSLYSHASAIQQATTAAIAGDWLHLTSTAVWLGGLVQFWVIIPLVRRHLSSTPALSTLVNYFSNFVRVAVAGLIVSGFYTAWLQVGSIDGLLNTNYGRILLIKMLLILPLLAVSGMNLVFTKRGLQNGKNVWEGRLRGLIGVEVTLAVSIIAAVGILTAIPPARVVMAVENAEIPAPIVEPFFEMQMGETLMAHLEINPGYVGENTFVVNLYDRDGNPVSDITGMRLRFDHLEQNLGQSELRPELNSNGTYSAIGANLSVPGEWRIRLSIQREGEFDTILDFLPIITTPPPPPAPIIETAIPALELTVAMLVTGVGLFGIGGFFAAQIHPRWRTGTGLMIVLLFAVGAIFLINAALNVGSVSNRTGILTVRDAWMLQMSAGFTGGVYLAIENGTERSEELIGINTPAAESVELHQTRIEDNGVARMIPTNTINIAPDTVFTFAPRNYHIMLLNLISDFNPGDTFPVTLMFASGRSITTEVQVVAQPPENSP